MSENQTHISVLFDEALDALMIHADGIYIDGTFGRGGHTRGILSRLNEHGRVYAMDKDPAALQCASEELKQDQRFVIVQASFADMKAWADKLDITGKVDGVLLDLGVSSPQLDDPQRGFSFKADGPLDMRMDPAQGESASQWLAHVDEQDLAVVLKNYGEERYARRIARAIVAARQEQPITTTLQLAEIVAAAHPAWEKGKHPATRSFQAVRIYINRELEDLETCLQGIPDVLKPGGRLVVISFHSLEDRIVKQFIHKQSQGEQMPHDLPVMASQLSAGRLKKVGKMLQPSGREVDENVRARSARMRIAEKVA